MGVMRKRTDRRIGLAFPLTLFASIVLLAVSVDIQVAQAQTDTNASEDYSTGTVVEHTVVAGENLYRIAGQYGVTVDELRLWNHLTTDLLQIGQVLKVIPETTAPIETPTEPEVPSENDDHSGDVVTYQVKAGDTLWSIGQRFGVTPNNLRLWNHLTTDLLQIGQELKMIPDITNPTYPEEPDDHSGDVVTYTVKSGDTLWSIGQRFGVSLNNLRLWNHLTTDLIRVNQQIKLIPPESGPTQPETPQETTTYTVKSGDTLWGISRRYNVTVNQLKTWNGLTSNFLAIGQTLKVTQQQGTYVVKAGDTLWNIAVRHNTSVQQIKNWNGLTSNIIHINQRLIIK